MHQKTDSDSSCLGKEKHKDVNGYCPVGMQRMKIDTTAVRIKNWRGKQMIQIHQHRQQENQVSFLPLLSEKSICNKNRKTEMKKIMNKNLHHTHKKPCQKLTSWQG